MDIRDALSGVKPNHFWYRGKRDLLAVLLGRTFGKPSGALSILNIGCGTGDDLHIVAGYGRVYALDISAETLELIPGGLVEEKTLGSAEELPYADSSFDLVLALDVLEHVGDDRRAAAEIERVLRPGGKLICTVPAHPSLYGPHDLVLGHRRRYTREGFLELFGNMRIREKGHWMFFLFPAALLQRTIEKSRKRSSGGLLPRAVNSVFYCVLRFESMLIRFGLRFPAGLSIYLIAEQE